MSRLTLRGGLVGLVGLVGLIGLVGGCGELPAQDDAIGQHSQAISVNAQTALNWVNGWISEVKADATKLEENVYTTDSPALLRVVGTQKAKNRSVCGTLVTQLFQQSLGFTESNFFNSFNKAMDSCTYGKVSGVNIGTKSPNAAQYRYKIENCAGTGVIQFTKRTTIGAIEAGDVLAVTYPESTTNSGHVMIVRNVPVVDSGLPAGPSGSTAYAVEVVDSTETPHGTSTTYADWRGGDTGEGLGHGTFVLYANSSGTIVASRWSPTDPTLFDTTDHPLAVGGLN